MKLPYLLRKIIGFLNEPRELDIIRGSGLFDEHWYLENNPDIVKVDPVLHYLRSGALDGRDPGPNFSSSWYLNTYADVKKAGINPLIHYLKYGNKEGRVPQPIAADIFLQEYSVSENKLVEFSSIDLAKQKVFCIGLFKTGTTSIESALKDFGYKMGFQPQAELLMEEGQGVIFGGSSNIVKLPMLSRMCPLALILRTQSWIMHSRALNLF